MGADRHPSAVTVTSIQPDCALRQSASRCISFAETNDEIELSDGSDIRATAMCARRRLAGSAALASLLLRPLPPVRRHTPVRSVPHALLSRVLLRCRCPGELPPSINTSV